MNKNILIDQCGYYSAGKKLVTIRTEEEKDNIDFEVRKSDNTVAYSSSTIRNLYNDSSQENTYIGDFSDVSEPGMYYIYAKGVGESDYFPIGEDVYDETLKKAIYFFYLQRCGMQLPEKYAGIYAHPECHTTLARVLHGGDRIDVTGGWHDAGDYGRYVVAAAMAVAQLLLAYESYPGIVKICKNPEDGTELPSYLSEIKYELDWMLKMQREDGLVYHKVTCENFCGFVMPQEETKELVVCPVSGTATADYAAVMAMAARYYEKYNDRYADRLKEAAVKAYTALKGFSQPGGFHNPENILTGEYGDESDQDERYWAAAEMYRTFGDVVYREDFEKMASENICHGYGWTDMGSYGNIAYLECDDIDDDIAKAIKASMVELADGLLAAANNDGYGVALKKDEYIWGSNLSVCNNGIHLMDAYKLTGRREYLEAAHDQLHYILGRNPMGLCYISGCGTTPIMHPHHRPSGFLGRVMPGMLSGGPCDWGVDELAKELLPGVPPAKCLLDMTGSYSTNEVTIYWNSGLVMLMALIQR